MGLRFGIPIEDGQLGPGTLPDPGKGPGAVGASQYPHGAVDQFWMLSAKGKDLLVKGMEAAIEVEIVIPVRLTGGADFLGFEP